MRPPPRTPFRPARWPPRFWGARGSETQVTSTPSIACTRTLSGFYRSTGLIHSEDKRRRVYVSTTTGSVTRQTDNRRQFDADFISDIHRLAFIPDKVVRDWVLVGLTAATPLVAVAGVALFFATRPRRVSIKER